MTRLHPLARRVAQLEQQCQVARGATTSPEDHTLAARWETLLATMRADHRAMLEATAAEVAAQTAEVRRCNLLRQPGPGAWMDYYSPQGRLFLLAGDLVRFAEYWHLPLALPPDLVDAYLAEEDSLAQWRLLQQYARRSPTGSDQ